MVISTLLLAKAAISVNLQNFCALKLDASGKLKISVGKTEIAAVGKGEIVVGKIKIAIKSKLKLP